MPRGPHSGDADLFAPHQLPRLRQAVGELSWLLERRYSPGAALELVGDHHQLTKRQRDAVRRCACGPSARRQRRAQAVKVGGLRGQRLAIDGFNVLITVESGLAGAPILLGCDGAYRDLSSVHGSYRRASTTAAAVEALGSVLMGAAPAQVVWYLDRPVSNSGRVRARLQEAARLRGVSWQVEVVMSPDRCLASFAGVVATSDSGILDRGVRWVDLPAAALAAQRVWLINLDAADDGP